MARNSSQSKRLRIYIGENDKYQGKPLYHAIILKTRELGLSGATTLRGIEGFGENSKIRSARILDISSDLPIVIDVVESAYKIDLLLAYLDTAVSKGLVTIENVEAIRYTEK